MTTANQARTTMQISKTALLADYAEIVARARAALGETSKQEHFDKAMAPTLAARGIVAGHHYLIECVDRRQSLIEVARGEYAPAEVRTQRTSLILHP